MPIKARYFTGIAYPESAPEDWQNQLRDSLNMWLISPLHQPDGEHDKPHHHLMYCHSNTIGLNAARRLFPTWAFTHPDPEKFIVSSPCNLARYFLHLDQPEKEQFEGDPYELLTAFNGFPLSLERQLTHKQERELRVALQASWENNSILEFADACRFARDCEDWEAYDYINSHYGWCNAWFSSVRNSGGYYRSEVE